MTLRIVLATRNLAKLAELQRILAAEDIAAELLSARDVDVPEVDETGDTFEDNAVLKARTTARALGLPAAADDSGLVVDALGGEPGVRSARYAGRHGDDAANLALVLDRMEGKQDRTARFVCVAALADPAGRTWTAHGLVEGALTEEPRGTGGFGYDPIFCPLGESRTTAEMPAQEKDAISHRGQAFRLLADAIAELAGEPG